LFRQNVFCFFKAFTKNKVLPAGEGQDTFEYYFLQAFYSVNSSKFDIRFISLCEILQGVGYRCVKFCIFDIKQGKNGFFRLTANDSFISFNPWYDFLELSIFQIFV